MKNKSPLEERVQSSKRHSCTDCGSSDGLAVYEDHTYCFACGTHTWLDRYNNQEQEDNSMNYDPSKIEEMSSQAIPDRRLPEKAVAKYGVKIELDSTGMPRAHHYPIYERGKHNPANIGYITRYLPKTFAFNMTAPVPKAGLFGAHLFPPGCSKAITVTEGALDCLAAYVMQGQKWPTVSIIGGADAAEKEFKRNLEYLESFEKVYICMDRDDPGQHAAISCAKLLSPGKAFIVKMDPELKDPCEYLKQGRSEQFIREWWAAPLYTPAGILSSSTVKERIRNREHAPSVPYPFEGLNSLTYGIRKGEAVIVTADTGVGKTSFLREVQHSILEHDKDAKVGTMYLEETPEDSGLGMMSVSASIPFHLPDAKYTEEEYKEAEKILDEDRVFFYDSFGSNNIDEIISRVRYYARGLGCGYIILDHLSIIVSDHQQGDERKKLDEIMTKLKTLTIELNIALIAAVHVNRSGQIRGTAGIEQLANMVIKLSRDIVNPDPIKRNLVNYLVGKNRFAGKTGPACVCKYDDDTGRTVEVNDETYKVSDEELTKFFNSDTMEAEHG